MDFLEVLAESFIPFGGGRRRSLHALAERWPIVLHGLSLSIGGIDPLDEVFVAGVADLCKQVKAPHWSDHLAFSTHKGIQLQQFVPLPRSEEAVEHVVRRIQAVRHVCDVPLLLENVSFYSTMPGSTLEEPVFLRLILEKADVGLLLDVSNIFVNSRNFRFDPETFIESLPLERVRELHLGGHSDQDEMLLDSHAAPISDEVWALYEFTLKRLGRMVPTAIEWETELPSLDHVLEEVDKARSHAAEALSSPTRLPE